jgi:tetratricopeptide (TPR) repeat protein
VFGHLLTGYIHAASRRSDEARAAFETVLGIDPYQPRALLGLARIAFERGEGGTCRELLERALRVYPDFPEARALLGVVVSVGAPRTGAEPAAPGGAAAPLERLSLPVGSRECLLVDSTGRVLFSHGAARDPSDAAVHLRRIARIASATLDRARLGALRSAVIESGDAATFLRCDDRLLLSLGLPRDVASGMGQHHADHLWQRCLEAMEASS